LEIFAANLADVQNVIPNKVYVRKLLPVKYNTVNDVRHLEFNKLVISATVQNIARKFCMVRHRDKSQKLLPT